MAQKQYLTLQEFLQRTLVLAVPGVLLSIVLGTTLSSISPLSPQNQSTDIPKNTDTSNNFNLQNANTTVNTNSILTTESRGDCYNRVGQELAQSEAGKVVTHSLMNQYYDEFISRCGGN
ncbi:hypothetical protein [Nostoc sp. FACHB-190]|uniref:hypothetical protein n=1 Tax=Nostoc sp. FACHB-190 TaxID=2692838 RepID=UPI001682A2DE|nr:hypothetical protein [Nostoc sp. FACHB-190]MBD2298935.1 hypothetical protein [Nostoc sp. FACHB-190]